MCKVRSLEMIVLLLILLVVVFAELLAHSYLKDGKVWRERKKKMHEAIKRLVAF